MTDPALETLERFLTIFDGEAVAHAREALSPAQEIDIASFARGELQGGNRERLIELMARNAVALEYLADLLRSRAAARE